SANVLAVAFAAVSPRKRVAPEQLIFGFLVLGLGHEFAIAKLCRALEWDDRRIAPGALQVRGPPRRLHGSCSRWSIRGRLADDFRAREAHGNQDRGAQCDSKQMRASSNF